jgi:hypothetical protein
LLTMSTMVACLAIAGHRRRHTARTAAETVVMVDNTGNYKAAGEVLRRSADGFQLPVAPSGFGGALAAASVHTKSLTSDGVATPGTRARILLRSIHATSSFRLNPRLTRAFFPRSRLRGPTPPLQRT